MKKMLILVGICSAFAGFSQSQSHVQLGLKAGLNVSNVHGNSYDYNARPGFHTGGLAHIHLNKTWAIQPEIVFSSQGAGYEAGGVDYRTRLDYINIPVLVQLMTPSGFRVETGPQIGALIAARSRADEGTNVNVNDDFRSGDFSWVFGVGYLFPSGFGLDARYNAGISKISDDNDPNLRNGVFQFGVFYQFPPLKHKH